jgi:multisubunit sodium/proton antiporter, MrpC subunit (2.A.63.1)
VVQAFIAHYPYFMTVALLVIGLYGMIGKHNLVKKVIGMNIFQTAVILFFVYGSAKWGATVPVIDPRFGTDPANYINPLPHVLMLTAIVVSVATMGVALALLLMIYRRYHSLDEREILERMRK